MSPRISRILGVSSLGVFALSLSLSVARDVAAQRAGTPPNPIAPVTVTNTPLDVVLQGVTQVGGNVSVTGTVQAQQSGPWTVDVATMPSIGVATLPPVRIDASNNAVTIANSDADPVPVRHIDAAVDVFQKKIFAPFEHPDGTLINSSGRVLLVVPADKRLVVENVAFSVTMSNTPNQGPVCSISAPVAGEFQVQDVAMHDNGHGNYVGSALTKLYFGPGTQVNVGCFRRLIVGQGGMSATVSGYFVPVP